MNRKSILMLLLSIAITVSAFSQILDPIHWSFDTKKLGKNKYELIFKANIDQGWHLYSQDVKPDDPEKPSPIPTSFNFEKNSAFQKLGKVAEKSKVHKEWDPEFKIDLKFFSNEAIFSQKVKLVKPIDDIKGWLEFMCCDDKQCLPPKDIDFSFKVKYEELSDNNNEATAAVQAADTDAATHESSKPQILDPVHWTYEFKSLDEGEAELIFTANIDNNWHLYSAYLEEGGPKPTSFIFDDNESIELMGKIEEKSEVEEVFDSIFEIKVRFFSNKAVFSQKIKFKGDINEIKGVIEYMTCDDKQCVPNEKEFSIIIGDEEQLALDKTEDESLWGFFILAISIGFLGVITPCVYPMIPMTVTFFMGGSQKKSKGRTQGIFYGVSIIFIYTVIGLIISATLGPDAINVLISHWLPNIIFFLLFLTFAASFFGMFEIVLPNKLVNRADKQSDKGGYLGTFFMALTLVLVSFSCTAPFVLGLLIEASQGAVLKPVIGMLGFSLAFALPFTFLAFFPALLSKMPKSGGWMNTVKVVLAFIILAFGMKYLAAADTAYHRGLLPRDLFIAIWIVIFTLMGFYLLGKIKFAHDSDVKHISVPRLLLIIATFSFVVYLIPGLFGAPLKAIGAFLPPESSHTFNLKTIISENSGKKMTSSSANEPDQGLCDVPKYSDFLHLQHGLKGYFNYEQGLLCAKEQNKPIFLSFMGHFCTNCHDMEAKVWSDPQVLKLLNEEFVIIALFVDDPTKLPESEWITAKYDGKVKKTIGRKYWALQIDKFNTNGQPYYVLMDNDEQSLLSPYKYNTNIQKFIDFLNKGIEEYKKNHPA